MKTAPKLDKKYKVQGSYITKMDGTLVTSDQWVVFLAKDNAVPETLQFYYHKCKAMGCDQTHLDGILQLMMRVQNWREANPNLCKVPDTSAFKLHLSG